MAADAPASVVAETVIPRITHPGHTDERAADTTIPFTLDTGGARIRGDLEYRVRAWLDRESRGEPAADDLHSDVAHPVLTHGAGRTVDIRLRSTC